MQPMARMPTSMVHCNPMAGTRTSPPKIAPTRLPRVLNENTEPTPVPRIERPRTQIRLARGKVMLAAQAGEAIPESWGLTKEGKPTTNPQEALEGLLRPVGDYKGFGIAVVLDMLSGVLTGSAYARGVDGLVGGDPYRPLGTGHFFTAMQIAPFTPLEEFKARMDDIIRQVKGSDLVEGEERVYLPDFPEHAEEAAQAGHGGGDFFMCYHFSQAIRTGEPPYLDVYRGVAMSIVGILAYRSALDDGNTVVVPDVRDPEVRARIADDDWNPDPSRRREGYPLPSVLGDIKPPAEGLAAAREVWREMGYEGE